MPRPIRLRPKAMSKKPTPSARAGAQDGAVATKRTKPRRRPLRLLRALQSNGGRRRRRRLTKRALRFHLDKCALGLHRTVPSVGWAFDASAMKRRAFAAERLRPRRRPTRRGAAGTPGQAKARLAEGGETLELNNRNDRRSAETLEIKGGSGSGSRG